MCLESTVLGEKSQIQYLTKGPILRKTALMRNPEQANQERKGGGGGLAVTGKTVTPSETVILYVVRKCTGVI